MSPGPLQSPNFDKRHVVKSWDVEPTNKLQGGKAREGAVTVRDNYSQLGG